MGLSHLAGRGRLQLGLTASRVARLVRARCGGAGLKSEGGAKMLLLGAPGTFLCHRSHLLVKGHPGS